MCIVRTWSAATSSSGELLGVAAGRPPPPSVRLGTHSFAVGDAGNPLLLGHDVTGVKTHGDAGSGHAAVPEVDAV